MRVLRAHGRDPAVGRRAASPRSTSSPTLASVRSCRRISDWPTIPQLFIDGELIGGCDIVTEMYQSGELQQTLGLEAPERRPRRPPTPAAQTAPLTIENRL